MKPGEVVVFNYSGRDGFDGVEPGAHCVLERRLTADETDSEAGPMWKVRERSTGVLFDAFEDELSSPFEAELVRNEGMILATIAALGLIAVGAAAIFAGWLGLLFLAFICLILAVLCAIGGFLVFAGQSFAAWFNRRV